MPAFEVTSRIREQLAVFLWCKETKSKPPPESKLLVQTLAERFARDALKSDQPEVIDAIGNELRGDAVWGLLTQRERIGLDPPHFETSVSRPEVITVDEAQLAVTLYIIRHGPVMPGSVGNGTNYVPIVNEVLKRDGTRNNALLAYMRECFEGIPQPQPQLQPSRRGEPEVLEPQRDLTYRVWPAPESKPKVVPPRKTGYSIIYLWLILVVLLLIGAVLLGCTLRYLRIL